MPTAQELLRLLFAPIVVPAVPDGACLPPPVAREPQTASLLDRTAGGACAPQPVEREPSPVASEVTP